MNETETILGELYKINGKQRTNFRIFNNYIKKNGSKGFSKWIYYLDATKEQKQKATHRTLLKNEIVLDYDPEKNETLNEITTKVKKVCEDLKNKQIAYKCYFTGSRGYHIHIFRYKMFFMNNIERIEYFGDSPSSVSNVTFITASMYDNAFVSHMIPRTDNQTRWITASII